MKAQFFQALLKRLFVSDKKRKTSGFTILEVLIATIIVTIVIVVLMDIVVDLLKTDRTEFGRSETQREMQMTLDFMVDDLREAAYVYNNQELNSTRGDQNNVPKLRDYLPPFTQEMEPILAFWKVEPVPYQQNQSLPNCQNYPQDSLARQQCNLLQIKRRAYTLVVYLYTRNDPNDPKWKGRARIMRYELRKYQNINNLTISQGYLDPATPGVSFSTWPLQGNGNAPDSGMPTRPNDDPKNRPVLVDFVDEPRTIVQRPPQNISEINDLPCPTNATNSANNYSRVPSDRDKFNSFFVCVSPSSGIVSTATGQIPTQANQDIILYLRGNPTGRAGIKVAPLLTVRTQAIARGVVNKTPE